MRVFLALILGIIIGVAGYWYYNTREGRVNMQAAGDKIEDAAKSTRDAVAEKLRTMKIRPEDIQDELARTGRVIRSKAQEAGQAIADATADTRTTAAIKAKLVANSDLSALKISVNTTGGVVTLAGTAPSAEAISKAMLIAMETDGVKQVISTVQVQRS
jgi:hyperosmotically inducible periplasmic protein